MRRFITKFTGSDYFLVPLFLGLGILAYGAAFSSSLGAIWSILNVAAFIAIGVGTLWGIFRRKN